MPDLRLRAAPPLLGVVWVIASLRIAVVVGLSAELDGACSGFIRTDLRSLERAEGDLADLPWRGK